MEVNIFDIQRFSVHDGPGIRTTVFFKGCPLRCLWCHNPESLSSFCQMGFYQEKCTLCGCCEAVCANHSIKDGKHIFNREKCVVCGNCAESCPNKALEKLGYKTTPEEILLEVKKDESFYKNSGGGMTVSGGEPFYQAEALYSLVRSAKEAGLHICIETSGFAKREAVEKIAPFVDIFLFDFKESNDIKHREFTGQSNELILSNLALLDSLDKEIILRCPIIPSLNDREDHLDSIAKLVATTKNIRQVQIMAYHRLGLSKYASLGEKNSLDSLESMDKSYKKELAQKLTEKIKKLTDRKIKVE